MVVHGAVSYTLVDTVSGTAVVSLTHSMAPTIDMQIGYLGPCHGTRTVRDCRRGSTRRLRRDGRHQVTDANDTTIATTRGVYKTN